MKFKALGAFRSKLLNRKFLQIFKFRVKKPAFIKRLGLRGHKFKHKRPSQRKRITELLSMFQSQGKVKRGEVSSASTAERETLLFPSPITPASLISSSHNRRKDSSQEEVEDACRSFENYLVEMIVEEGRVKDLMDVEELLFCWKNLKCPVFIDLVCRFYGELCKDLFAPHGDEAQTSTPK